MRLWPNGTPVCPHCGVIGQAGRLSGQRAKPSRVYPEGKPIIGLWKCYACRKQFTVRMKSIFESSHVPLHIWLQAIHLIASSKKGFGTNQLQRTLGGSMKTAWFLSRRIRECMKDAQEFVAGPLGGAGKTLEADETYVGGKAENRAYAPVPPEQIVMALVERGGAVRSDLARADRILRGAKGKRLTYQTTAGTEAEIPF
jgi:transposase-like protein